MNPFSNTLQFLGRGGWPLILFWLLLAASIGLAVYNLRKDPEQRTTAHVWTWIARLLVGGMWWQQTLWKLPPTFTDNPDGVSGGLHYWVEEMVKNAAFGWHSNLVKSVIQPNFYFFAAQVYAVEVVISASLLLGLFTRLGGALGALMALNLWLGLYRHPAEWPWSYFFLILLQVTFAVLGAGRSLGADAIIARRQSVSEQPPRGLSRVLAWIS